MTPLVFARVPTLHLRMSLVYFSKFMSYVCTSSTAPLTYSSVGQLNGVHSALSSVRFCAIVCSPSLPDIGEVWANMLHNVLAALVRDHSFDNNAFSTPTSTAGNAVFMHLFLDSLLLQPCNPTCASSSFTSQLLLYFNCCTSPHCSQCLDPSGC